MSIYLKIGNTTYKVPNRTIVGRGEPFTPFLEDRSVARAHILVLRKKDGVYIKDLGTSSGTFINGQKIKKKKLVKWNATDDLKLGDFQVGQLAAANDKECVHVSAIRGFKNWSVEVLKWIICLGMVLATYDIWTDKGTIPFKIFMTGIFAVISYIIFHIQKFVIQLITPKDMHVTDVFLGEDGFTAHYDAGGNMTLKLIQIKSWRNHLGGAVVKMKNDEVYNFVQMSNRGQLIEYLKKHVPDLEFKPKIPQSIQVVGGFAIGIGLVHFKILENVSEEVILGLAVLAVAAAALFTKKEANWMPKNKFMNNKKLAMMFGGFALLIGAMDFFGPDKREIAQGHQRHCTEKKTFDCEFINYKHLSAKEIDPKKVTLACDLGNKSACKHLGRVPASIKK